MKEYNLGDVVRLKFHPHAIGAKYDGREGVIVEKIQIIDEYAYSVNVIGAEMPVHKNNSMLKIIGTTSVIGGLYEDDLELVKA